MAVLHVSVLSGVGQRGGSGSRPPRCGLLFTISVCLAPQLDHIDPRAVQLGALLVRGLTMLVLVNSACGFPWRTSDFMPWNVFDGKLFHEKYLQSEKGYSAEALVEQNVSSQLFAPTQGVGLHQWPCTLGAPAGRQRGRSAVSLTSLHGGQACSRSTRQHLHSLLLGQRIF